MAYDPTEMFRVDPGEMELSEEAQAQMELERQSEEAAAQAAQMATTPTGGQPGQAQPTQPATAGMQQEQQFPWEQGYDIGDAARQVVQGGMTVPAGLVDFGVDVINKVTGQSVPKPPEFQTKHLQALREIASVVAPTIILSKLGMGGAATAHSRVGWSVGNNAFVKAIGTLGI